MNFTSDTPNFRISHIIIFHSNVIHLYILDNRLATEDILTISDALKSNWSISKSYISLISLKLQ